MKFILILALFANIVYSLSVDLQRQSIESVKGSRRLCFCITWSHTTPSNCENTNKTKDTASDQAEPSASENKNDCMCIVFDQINGLETKLQSYKFSFLRAIKKTFKLIFSNFHNFVCNFDDDVELVELEESQYSRVKGFFDNMFMRIFCFYKNSFESGKVKLDQMIESITKD